MRNRIGVVVAGIALASIAASACGAGRNRNFNYDCSNGQVDGYGGCIPNWHAPRRIEAAARRHFAGMQVDRVACFNNGEFQQGSSWIRVWGCVRVADGRLIGDDVACIAARGGRPLVGEALDAIPAGKLRCVSG